MNRPCIVNEVDRNPINTKFPPNRELYGDEFSGYKNRTEEILFYEFLVLKKDISFTYKGVKYYLYSHNTPVTAYNANTKKVIEEYENEFELIEKFSIDNKPFIELIDEIYDVEAYLNVFKPHFVIDNDGYVCNSKYPSNKTKYGCLYNGYKESFLETIFYNFGVQNYDLYFKYKGKEYYVLNEFNYVALCDENFTEEYEVYANEMDFIENFKIDGKPLIELIDELEEVDPM